MEQFSLEKWLQDKSRKVVTRNGRPVRIVCWDKLGDYPIIGCIKYSDDYEDLESYNSNGFKYSSDREDQNDLFFADEEEELTEFEKSVRYVLGCYACKQIEFGDRADNIKFYAETLLDLARKEVEKEYKYIKSRYIKKEAEKLYSKNLITEKVYKALINYMS